MKTEKHGFEPTETGVICNGCNVEIPIGDMAYILEGGDVMIRDGFAEVDTEACREGGGQLYYCPSCIERKEKAITGAAFPVSNPPNDTIMHIIPSMHCGVSHAVLAVAQDVGDGHTEGGVTLLNVSWAITRIEEMLTETPCLPELLTLKAVMDRAIAMLGDCADVIMYAD